MPLIRKPAAPPPRPADTPDRAAQALMLRTGTADERWDAARNLGEIPGSAPILGDALAGEPDPRVREAIFTGLIVLGGEDSVREAIRHLRSDDAGLRTGATDVLRALIGVTRPHLPALLRDADADIRILSCDLVRELPPSEVRPLLGGILGHDENCNVCAAAVEVLAEIGGEDALPLLDQCAARLPPDAFLGFAIGVARTRILARRGGPG